MMDNNQRSQAADIAADDPFAELTRIMGFDPRTPSREAAPAEERDWSLDLERELLGGFAEPAAPRAEAAPQPAAARTTAPVQPAVEPDLDFSIDLAAELDDTAKATPAVPATAAPVAAPVAKAPDFAFDDLDFGLDDAPARRSAAGAPAAAEAVPFAETAPASAGPLEAPAIDAQPREARAGSDTRLAADPVPPEPTVAPTPAVAAAPAASRTPEPSVLDSDFDAFLRDLGNIDLRREAEASARAEGERPADTAPDARFGEAEKPDNLSAIATAPIHPEPALLPKVEAAEPEPFVQMPPQAMPAAAQAEPAAGEPRPQAASGPAPRAFPLTFGAGTAAAYPAPVDPADDPLRELALLVEPSPPPAPAAPAEDLDLDRELDALLAERDAEATEPAIEATPREPAAAAPRSSHEQRISEILRHPARFLPRALRPATPQRPSQLPEIAQPVAAVSPAFAEELASAPEPVVDEVAADVAAVEHDLADLDLAFEHAAAELRTEDAGELAALGDDVARVFDEAPPAADPDDLPGFEADLAAAFSPGLYADDPEPSAAEPASVPLVEEPSMPSTLESRREPLADLLGPERGPAASPFGGRRGGDDEVLAPLAFSDAPEIDTVEIGDRAIALADDLDLPELPRHDELPPVAAYDDLDGEFENLLSEMNGGDAASPARHADTAGGLAAVLGTDKVRGEAAIRLDGDDRARGQALFDDAFLDGTELTLGKAGGAASGLADYDPDLDEAIEIPTAAAAAPPRRRGLLIAGLLAGVAAIGVVGVFAMSSDFGGSSGEPVLVKADGQPIKVKPANPGGTAVPNQDNKVYDKVAGAAVDDPQQQKLVSSEEEPVEIPPPVAETEEEMAAAATDGAADDATAADDGEVAADGAVASDAAAEPAGGKSEDRVASADVSEPDTDMQVAAIAPRKVRTMVVKPDGTLAPREETTPDMTAGTASQAVAEVPAATSDLATDAIPAAPANAAAAAEAAPAAAEAAPVDNNAPATADAEPAANPVRQATMPDVVPIAPTRPAEQPVDVVGEVKPDQVAALAPSAATAAGSWGMQIASQPTEAAARSSYADLARRFPSLLNGRQVSIAKAEIAGKGTFWRVRVPAGSRAEAVSLCESYKGAGGNCFVSR